MAQGAGYFCSRTEPSCMVTTRGDDAAALFTGGWSCSQAVACAFARDYGIDEQAALRLSCGLGGGMGHTGNTCGAVSGALLVIGMKYGRDEIDDLAAKDKTYEIVQAFMEEFRRRNHSVNCTELVGYDLSDPGRLAAARERKVFHATCTKYVRDAAEILEGIL